MSDTIAVWILLIDDEYKPIGTAFRFPALPGTLIIDTLRNRIQSWKTNGLAHVDAHMLTIFECTDSSIDLVDDDDETGEEGTVLNKVKKVFSDKKVKKLSLRRTMASLQLQNDTLIVQVPSAFHELPFCFVLKYFCHHRCLVLYVVRISLTPPSLRGCWFEMVTFSIPIHAFS
jgi:hypothetical protein